MRAFSTLALVGTFAASLFSSAVAAPHSGLANVNAPISNNDVTVLDTRSLVARCGECDAHGTRLFDVLTGLQVNINAQVVALTNLETYTVDNVAPCVNKIVADIKIAVAACTQIVADVKASAGAGVGVGVGAVVGVVVQVAVIAQLLVAIVISIVTILAHIIVSVGGNVSVCGAALVEVGVQLQILLDLCFSLVFGLKIAVVALIAPIAALIKICGFIKLGVFLGIAL